MNKTWKMHSLHPLQIRTISTGTMYLQAYEGYEIAYVNSDTSGPNQGTCVKYTNVQSFTYVSASIQFTESIVLLDVGPDVCS